MSTLEIPVVAAAAAAPGQVPVAVAVAVPQAAAVAAAPTASSVTHWSGVHMGAEFQCDVAPTKEPKETRTMTVRLRPNRTRSRDTQRRRPQRLFAVTRPPLLQRSGTVERSQPRVCFANRGRRDLPVGTL